MKYKIILFALFTPVLFYLSWTSSLLYPLLIFALVPLLLIEYYSDKLRIKKILYFLILYISLFVSNLSIVYWLYGTSKIGGVLVFLLNPLLLIIPFILKRIYGNKNRLLSGVFFISSWLIIESINFSTQFAFPFFTLGFALSSTPQLVQFYEYTGILGGSLLILVINILIYYAIINYIEAHKIKALSALLFSISILTVVALFSLNLYNKESLSSKPIEFVSLHTSIDCRTEKYTRTTEELVYEYIKDSKSALSKNTRFLIWPETAITNLETIDNINSNVIGIIDYELIKKHPKLNLVTGGIIYEILDLNRYNHQNENARYSADGDFWYLTYNAALTVSNKPPQYRTKFKLVPIEETIPYSSNFKFLRAIIKSLGGFKFSHKKIESEVFYSSGLKYATLICYESLFPEFASKLVIEGAELLFIISNEGWIKNNVSAKQFLHYSSALAICNRREIVKSSNQGCSAHIDSKGNITNFYSDYDSNVIRGNIRSFNQITFYAKHPYVIEIIAMISLLSLLTLKIFYIYKSRFTFR